MVAYTLVTITILVVSSAAQIINQITTLDNRYYFDQLVHTYTSILFDSINRSALIGRVTLFLSWAGIGAIVYMLVWFSYNSYLAVRNDIIIGTKYTGFYRQSHTAFWTNLLARSSFRLCATLLLLLLTTIVVQIWYPVSVTIFKLWLNNLASPYDWLLLFEAFWGWFMALHIGVILLRLVLLRLRIFGSA